ncbi:GTP-binding protein SAR1 isoform X3 [Cephus cinctus]|uniref:small monomeric GTPase n=1 Tax=Cephus cinctus TaxID=211228 RepID=A0AAJ7FGD5_CEPCN|nr:GTP-binding protein SAR1 isoform X3 [Cephus cinctus]
MFIWDWLTGVLGYLGMPLSVCRGRFAILGLPNSGRHSLLKATSEEHLIDPVAYLETSEELSIGNMRFTTFDLGGHSQARRVWKDYFPAVDAIVFLVDASDRSRLSESRAELDALLTDEQLSACPVLVLGNKIDKPGAASEDELRNYFNLYGQTTGKKGHNAWQYPQEERRHL